jgi:hypothetical protein
MSASRGRTTIDVGNSFLGDDQSSPDGVVDSLGGEPGYRDAGWTFNDIRHPVNLPRSGTENRKTLRR